MPEGKTEEGATVARKKPEHVDAAAWLEQAGPKFTQAARNVPGIMGRIKDGLRCVRDLQGAEDALRAAQEAAVKAAERCEALRRGVLALGQIRAELEPIVKVLP